MADDKNKGAESGGSGKLTKILIAVMAVLLVAAVGAISYLVGHKSAAPVAEAAADTSAHAEDKPADKKSDPVYLALDPPFVVNFQGDGATRFLQVGVQLMARDPKALDAAKASEPAVRNALVMLFSSQDEKTLLSREGKEKLRADALAEVRRIVADRAVDAPVEQVYFTSFVMQ